jgi:hypothetical protein
MKMYGGVNAKLHVILNSELYGGDWSIPRSGRFAAEEINPGTDSIEGWVGHRINLDVMARRKIPVCIGNRTPAVNTLSQLLHCLSYTGL